MIFDIFCCDEFFCIFIFGFVFDGWFFMIDIKVWIYWVIGYGNLFLGFWVSGDSMIFLGGDIVLCFLFGCVRISFIFFFLGGVEVFLWKLLFLVVFEIWSFCRWEVVVILVNDIFREGVGVCVFFIFGIGCVWF